MESLASDTTTIRIANVARLCAQASGPAPTRSRVLLNTPGNSIMRGHALEVSDTKLVVSIPTSLAPNDECAAFITVTVGDDIVAIVGTAHVIRCDGNPDGGYCARMKFTVDDEASRLAIKRLFETRDKAVQ